MKSFFKYCCLVLALLTSIAVADKLELTCEDRNLIVDSKTGFLEIEAPNNTLLTPDKTFRGIAYEKQDDIIKFRIITEFYTEGWAIDEASLMAFSRLDFIQDDELDPIKKRYACIETPEKVMPEKLPRQKVGKRPRKRGF